MPLLLGRARDERGVVLPTRLMVLSISAVALAGLAFVATDPNGPGDDKAAAVVAKPSPTPTPSVTPSAKPTRRAPVFRRADVYVEVFNNSGIKGLAGTTAAKARGAGWNVVGSDNWYGTVTASTVYYPDRLAAAAKALARDLGISRVRPAIEPMRFDRLTVILTNDYH